MDSVSYNYELRIPYIRILEQPASRAIRFRYHSDGPPERIIGAHSTSRNRTSPTIKIEGYQGDTIVIVSCIDIEPPYLAHPFQLVGESECNRGICCKRTRNDSMTLKFSKLHLQRVKMSDLEKVLDEREKMQVDPYGNGFSHKTDRRRINWQAFRLCFQAFKYNGENNIAQLTYPAYSVPIYDKRYVKDLIINHVSHASGPTSGNSNVILLCNKVIRDDVQILFRELNLKGERIWEGEGIFPPEDIHHSAAIAFRTPAYKDLHISSEVQVSIYLRRPSDGTLSNPAPFTYFPVLPLDFETPKRRESTPEPGTSTSSSNHPIPSVSVEQRVNGDSLIPLIENIGQYSYDSSDNLSDVLTSDNSE